MKDRKYKENKKYNSKQFNLDEAISELLFKHPNSTKFEYNKQERSGKKHRLPWL